MKKLKIKIGGFGHTILILKGLSFKALQGTDVGHDLVRGDSGEYELSPYGMQISGKTGNIALPYLIKMCKELHENIPFDKIEIIGHYEATGDELYNMVINNL